VRGWVDLRGAMGINPDVPVGYQTLQCTIRMQVAADADAERVRQMLIEAERSCIVLATLRRAVPVYLRVEQPAAAPAALAA
jgi:uncharacterized OsmC-like protein